VIEQQQLVARIAPTEHSVFPDGTSLRSFEIMRPSPATPTCLWRLSTDSKRPPISSAAPFLLEGRVGTDTCWMHVLSTRAYTFIHASRTRGADAISEMGVLADYTGVVIHDRLALYWKFKKARHGLCGAHLLRDLEEVGAVASQREWASGLARLLLEINKACDQARLAGHLRLAPTLVRDFTARYDTLVAAGIAANPDPASGRKRDYYERKSFNLVTAFATHKKPILRFMNDLDTPLRTTRPSVTSDPGRSTAGSPDASEPSPARSATPTSVPTSPPPARTTPPPSPALTDLCNGKPRCHPEPPDEAEQLPQNDLVPNFNFRFPASTPISGSTISDRCWTFDLVGTSHLQMQRLHPGPPRRARRG